MSLEVLFSEHHKRDRTHDAAQSSTLFVWSRLVLRNYFMVPRKLSEGYLTPLWCVQTTETVRIIDVLFFGVTKVEGWGPTGTTNRCNRKYQ